MTNILVSKYKGLLCQNLPTISSKSLSLVYSPDTEIAPDKERNSKTSERIAECKAEIWTINRRCVNCGKKAKEVTGHCFIRYCSHCYTSKFQRARNILDGRYKHLFDSTCKHLELTIPRQVYTKELKKFLEKSATKFFYILRHKYNYRFVAIKIFDYGNPIDSCGLVTNVHIHSAVSMHYAFSGKLLSKVWQQATGIHNAVVKIKKSKTSAVMRYFARRIAGDFGHGKQRRSFESVMSVEQYDALVYKSRCFTASIPKGYSCIHRAKVFQRCEYCGDFLALSCVKKRTKNGFHEVFNKDAYFYGVDT